MPVGYLIPVVLVAWGVACALTTWRALGVVAALPALLVNELPFVTGLWLVASTAVAVADGDLPADADTAGLARFVMMVAEGNAVHAAAGVGSEQLLAATEIALSVFLPQEASVRG